MKLTEKFPQVNEKLVAEMASYVKFDSENPDSFKPEDVNNRRCTDIMKRHFKSIDKEDEIISTAGGSVTLYNVLKKVPLMSSIGYIFGFVSYKEYLECIQEGLTEIDCYILPKGCSKEFVDQVVDAVAVLNNYTAPISEEELKKFELPELSEEVTSVVDTLLSSYKVPEYSKIRDVFSSFESSLESVLEDLKTTQKNLTENEAEVKQLNDKLAQASLLSLGKKEASEYKSEKGGIPDGTMVYKKASEVFPKVPLSVDFDIPFFEWEGEHPNVPEIKEDYIFRADLLEAVIYSILSNERAYFHGHTGSGKTTVWEQFCAYTNYPFVRVNFDSEITRMDLIGRDTLISDEDNNTVSKFVDGILPSAMVQPCIFCCDEIDFVRPDVAYAMQAPLEGNGVRITEDGDRFVNPHPMFRLVATGNTVGQGDEFGMYQGARPQSMAFLDRFTVWSKVDYLSKDQLGEMLEKAHPLLSTSDHKVILNYVAEHMEGFTSGRIQQPISPRGMLAIGQATCIFKDLKKALSMSVLNKANADDYATLKGIIDRVVG